MRRGSKCPSMLKKVLTPMNSPIEKELTRGSEEAGNFKGQQHRRLSLVSSLVLTLEKSALIETKVARKIRRMSIDHTLLATVQ